jgi:hypothetical protein
MSQTTNTLWDRCLILAKQAGELLGNGIDPVETEEALEVAIDRFIASRADLPAAVRPDRQEVRRVLAKVSSQEYRKVAHEIDQKLAAFR